VAQARRRAPPALRGENRRTANDAAEHDPYATPFYRRFRARSTGA
jgi:hypothetical protein